MERVVQTTQKGQITLPEEWRKNFSTDQFIIKQKANSLEIFPLDVKKIRKAKEYTVFDALRDNKGKGIKAKDLVNILKKLDL